MGKILTAFGNDELATDPVHYKGDAAYQEAITTAYKLAEKLNARHNEEEKNLFEQFCDANETAHYLFALGRFCNGYQLGVLMTTEIFTESDRFFRREEKPQND